jgi:adenylate cyclase
MAIFAADVAGYTRLMAADDRGTLASLELARTVFRSQIEAQQGRVVDMAGDSVLAVFETAVGAAQAALSAQDEVNSLASAVDPSRQMRFRVGIHLGDVIEKADGTVYGDGINIAARLQALANPGEISVSEAVRAVVKGRLVADFVDRGEHYVKNRTEAIRLFLLRAMSQALLEVAAIDVSLPVTGFGGRPAIAVLPFSNLSGDSGQDYIAQGLAEDILTRLALWRWYPVIARSSSFSINGSADVKTVARSLGARYLLEGSVRTVGTRIRVTSKLTDANSLHLLWADRFDRVIEDIFSIQDELTDGIVGSLEAAVGRAEIERVRVKAPQSFGAWDMFQRGMWHLQRFTADDFVQALSLLARSTELDSTLAAPHSAIAYLKMQQAFLLWTDDPASSLRDAISSARTALSLDPMDSTAHSIMGTALTFAGSHDEALTACRRGVDLNPSNPVGHTTLATAHFFRGEGDQAVAAAERAVRISPGDSGLHTALAMLAGGRYLQGDLERAVAIARLSLQHTPSYPVAWRILTSAFGHLSRQDEAQEALASLLALAPGFTDESAARKTLRFRDESVFQHYITGLRKAGWQG